MGTVTLRRAGPADAAAVARLHTLSWQNAYRGILTDHYLDDARLLAAHKASQWQRRLAKPSEPATQLLLVAEAGRSGAPLQGFVCVVLDADPRWGALLDNIHVHPAYQGRGLGRVLLSAAAAWVAEQRPNSSLYLEAYAENWPARRFYEHLGGTLVKRFTELAPDGSTVNSVRYSYDPRRLAATAAK